ncbi:hypothetical protein HN748_01270 [Candidatus Peregrinibacteria bacterium]|jgi:ppGpp synthetase/RelA/SpoT-type nucleotidyltranferase|nr:hypothetical protein [Candidatus Peregrinibacteria bacterium]
MTPEEILKKYDADAPRIKRLTKYVYRRLKEIRLEAQRNGIKVQAISTRENLIKSRESVEGKIKRKEYTNYSQLTDLSGVKVIFYYEDDIDGFAQLVHGFFSGHGEDQTRDAENYEARHITVSLQEEDVEEEDKDLVGMPCEVQLVSVLKHALSEVSHDVTYKDKEKLEDFSPEGFKHLKEGFSEVEEQFYSIDIKFQALRDRAELIKEARSVLSESFLLELIREESYESISKKLSMLSEAFGRFAFKANDQVCEVLISLLDKDSLEVKSIESRWGPMYGKNYQDIVKEVLNCALKLRNFYPAEVLAVVVKSAEVIGNEDELISDAVKVLFMYETYRVKNDEGETTRKISYYRQTQLVKQLEKWSEEECKARMSIFIGGLSEVLKASFNFFEAIDYQSLSSRKVYLSATKELKKIREMAFLKLSDVFFEVSDLDKLRVLECIESATRSQDSSGEGLKELIMESVDAFVQFIASIINHQSDPAILLACEHALVRLLHLYGDDVVGAKNELLKVRSKDLYVYYRQLVGRDSLYGLIADEEIKEEFEPDLKSLSEELKQKNIDDLSDTLNYIAGPYAWMPNYCGYRHFREFLCKFGESESDVSSKLVDEIERNEEKYKTFIRYFYSDLLRGLRLSNVKKVKDWEQENMSKESGQNVRIFLSSLEGTELDSEELEKSLSIVRCENGFEFVEAFEDDEKNIIAYQAIRLVLRLDTKKDVLKKEVVVSALKLQDITSSQADNLLNELCAYEYSFEDWTDDDLRLVQELLLKVRSIDDRSSQWILAALIELNPRIGVEVFKLRYTHSLDNSEGAYSTTIFRFDPVLVASLRKAQSVMGNEVIEDYFKGGDEAFYAAEIIKKIFEESELKNELSKKLEEGREKEVIGLMHAIGVSQGTIEVAMEIASNKKELHGYLASFVLSGTFGGGGEFAIEEAYQERLNYFNSAVSRLGSFSKGQKAYVELVRERLKANIDASHTDAISDKKRRQKIFEI